MNVQRAELLERLSTAHNFCNLDDEDNYIAASKAVRQVRGKTFVAMPTQPFSCDTAVHSVLHLFSAFHSNSDHLFVWLQVIHQLKQLGTVWQDVLPVSIYCKAMGSFLNTAITEVIAKIMMLEVCLLFCFIISLQCNTTVISMDSCTHVFVMIISAASQDIAAS